MSDIEKLPREYPEVDSRMTYEQEQTAQDILARKGINIDWTTGTIQAKNFVGSGEGLWDVGEGTGMDLRASLVKMVKTLLTICLPQSN